MKRKYEVAQIEKLLCEVGHFGGIYRIQIKVMRTSSSGTSTIMASKPFEWRKSLTSASTIDAKIRRQQREVIERLLADGWEPMSADTDGFVTSFKRPVHEPITRRFGSARFFRPFSFRKEEGEVSPSLLPETSPL